jgi:opacity protein-like surface antigen
MKIILFSAVAGLALASPAGARDHSPYVGIEGGALFAKDMDIDNLHFLDVDGDNQDNVCDNCYTLDFKTGIDLDLVGGYDFGMVRAEAELGWKKASVDQFIYAESPQFPQDGEGHVSILSLMGNVLLEFGNEDGLSFYAGPGFGRVRAKLHDVGPVNSNASGKDSAWAWQLIAGARYSISPNVDFGLKYRYFRTGSLRFEDVFDTAGETFNCATIPTAQIPCTFSDDWRGRFKSHSVLATLTYNFAAPPPPPPPPEPERG